MIPEIDTPQQLPKSPPRWRGFSGATAEIALAEMRKKYSDYAPKDGLYWCKSNQTLYVVWEWR